LEIPASQVLYENLREEISEKSDLSLSLSLSLCLCCTKNNLELCSAAGTFQSISAELHQQKNPTKGWIVMSVLSCTAQKNGDFKLLVG
jgi:hypothetical protein